MAFIYVWKDKFIGHTSDQIVAMVQAATIGQTFAMLSGVRSHVDIDFRGLLTSLTRILNIWQFSIPITDQ